jgi:drug/metabolite transporter (DMT)-like permease
MISAVLCWVIFSILSKIISNKFSPIVITSYSIFLCSILLIPFVLLEKPWINLHNKTSRGWIAIFLHGTFTSVIGFLIQQIAIREIVPRCVSMFGFLVPIVSIFLLVLILKEVLNPYKIFYLFTNY